MKHTAALLLADARSPAYAAARLASLWPTRVREYLGHRNIQRTAHFPQPLRARPAVNAHMPFSSPLTRAMYARALEDFFAWYAAHRFPAFHRATVQQYHTHHEAQPLGL